MSLSGESFSNSEKTTDCMFFCVSAFVSVFKLAKASNVVSSLSKASNSVSSMKLHTGAQGKHIKGYPNYMKGRSVINGTMGDAQNLLKKISGTGQKISKSRERVNFGEVIGEWVNPKTGERIETLWGIIHNGKNGTHIVPALYL